MAYIIGLYRNDTMRCEGLFGLCPRAVLRAYQPFCPECYPRAISRGTFKSRIGKEYRYNGRRWVFASPGDDSLSRGSGSVGHQNTMGSII